MSGNPAIGIGLVGCGGFGEFCLDAFRTVEGVRIAAVADVYTPAARRLAEKFGVPAFSTADELIACEAVGLVHVATPPSLHYEQVLAALKAGKHVLCEKPLATRVEQADEMLAAAKAAGAICPVNFVLRHNAVTDAVKAVLDSGAMGKVLAGRLTNCAGDSKLGPDHWFWDPALSGGIFIEHGVHFFDLYTHWLGAARVLDAHALLREDTTQEDRVMCTLGFESGAVAHHHHGFDQVLLMDRTDHRLVCELGDVRVDGWIPLTLTIDALVNEETQAQLEACCPGAAVEVLRTYAGQDCRPTGRGVERHVTKRVRLVHEPAPDKQTVYADSVRALLADQLAFLRDPSHTRRVTESNGRAALELAQAATRLAHAD